MIPEDVDRVERSLIDLAKAGVRLAPPPYNVMLGLAMPFLESYVRHQIKIVRTGLANGTLISDGKGGYVSKEWADDPRHQLNPDGTFKY